MPLSILLIPFFIFVLVFLAFFVSALFHVIRFELVNGITMAITTIFIIGTGVISIVATREMLAIDWNARVTFDVFQGATVQQQGTSEEGIQF